MQRMEGTIDRHFKIERAAHAEIKRGHARLMHRRVADQPEIAAQLRRVGFQDFGNVRRTGFLFTFPHDCEIDRRGMSKCAQCVESSEEGNNRCLVVRRRWKPHVFKGEEIDRRFYELCVLSELRNALRSGDLWVVGSRQFRDFEEYLLPAEAFTAMKPNELPLAIEREPLLPDRQREHLADTAAAGTALRTVIPNNLACDGARSAGSEARAATGQHKRAGCRKIDMRIAVPWTLWII